MKEYIEREATIKEIAKWLADVFGIKSESGAGTLFKKLRSIPAADVVEVDVKDLRVKKAIQTLCEFYSTAKKSDYVQKPLAWALYQTWKSFDKMDGGGDK